MAVGGPLRAGNLRHLITIRRQSLVDDGLGGQTREPQTVATVRAMVEGLDGREVMLAHALQGVSNYRITLRWREDLQSTDQVQLADGRNLNITSITDPDGRRIQLQIIATTASVLADAGAQ
jgi:SPP1 family predicted phage head-tail adaptor